MDKKDLQLVALLQRDATTPLAELAKAVNLSATPCWRRVQKLYQEGVIQKQVAICSAARLNVPVTVFVSIRATQHSDAWMKRFVQGTKDIPEIVEIYRMSGDIDYLLKVVVPDIAGYDKVYKRLVRAVELQDVSSSFAMEVLKSTTELPLDYAARQ
jgi:Lrp/AsnC family transcriptional regulator